MRTLHVAAMPYPTQQGTQALVHSMLSALAHAGHETHLVCYGQAAFERNTPYTVHRVQQRLLTSSFRSGPSLSKVLLDLVLLEQLRPLIARLRPEVVVAHHVEAASCALLASARPLVFVAHTSLEHELPSYFPRAFARACSRAGRSVDRTLCRRAAAVFAVSPRLSELLARHEPRVSSLPLPWSCPARTSPHEREAARSRFGLSPRDEVVLYAGNLDAYQGLAPLLKGLSLLARERSLLRLLVATQSDLRAVREQLRALGMHRRTVMTSLADEQERRAAHAAADLAVVPRGSDGGLPIKLLDALARGVPVIATRRASAGLSLDSVCRVIPDDDPGAFRDAVASHFESAPKVGHNALRYLRQHHSAQAFVTAFEHLVGPLRAAAPPL